MLSLCTVFELRGLKLLAHTRNSIVVKVIWVGGIVTEHRSLAWRTTPDHTLCLHWCLDPSHVRGFIVVSEAELVVKCFSLCLKAFFYKRFIYFYLFVNSFIHAFIFYIYIYIFFFLKTVQSYKEIQSKMLDCRFGERDSEVVVLSQVVIVEVNEGLDGFFHRT